MRDDDKNDDWRDLAACAGMGPDLFFPGHGESVEPAKRVCAHCPVKAACLESGMDEHFGVRGEKSEKQRRVIRRQRRRAAA